MKLSDHFPDPRRAAISDMLNRHLYFKGQQQTSHSTLTVGNEKTTLAAELERISSVQVGDVTGGTVTVQVYVGGVPLFDDSIRPVSGGGVMHPSTIFNFTRGTEIKTVIEADSGAPSGTANVLINTQPFVLVPRPEEVELHGADRLRVSRRRAVEDFNDFGDLRLIEAANRSKGGIGSRRGPAGTERRVVGKVTPLPSPIFFPPRTPGGGGPGRPHPLPPGAGDGGDDGDVPF